MILEGYLAKLKTYPEDEIKIVVTATAKSVLAPSWEILNAYKEKRITWREYAECYINEICNSGVAIAEVRRIKSLAVLKHVRLICYEKQYPCHRFILRRLIQVFPQFLDISTFIKLKEYLLDEIDRGRIMNE